MKKIWVIMFVCTSMVAYSQTDTLNRTDKFGKKYGYWKKYDDKKNLLYEGKFYNGEPTGEFIYYYPNGKKKNVSFYHPNSPEVNTVMYHSNGEKSAEGTFINKQKEGRWLYYSANKHLISEENYAKGQKNGVFKTYSSVNGVLLEESFWFNNQKHGYFNNYYTDGSVRIKMNYTYDKMHGAFENYYADGRIWNKGQYKNDFRVGEWICYREDGKELKIETIDSGIVTEMILGFQVGAQWQKINAKEIAYFYQSPTDIVIQLKNKKKLNVTDNLIDISKRTGREWFILINENVLSSYDAIKHIVPIDENEAKVILRLAPNFEVHTYDDYYNLLKAITNEDMPVEE